MENLKELTADVCVIAKQVGVFLREERKVFSLDRVEQKHSHDYVSYVDKTAEKMLVEKLGSLLPDAGFITEENTTAKSTKELNWIIDPLDGTTNYIQDCAPYCISLALRNGEDLLLGVVYEVCRDECYSAWKGGGAYLNDEKIRVTDKVFEEAFIGLDVPYNAEVYKPILRHLMDELYGTVSGVRINGSAAMGLCYVAAGRYDGWMEAFISSWDYSAGVVLVREAGGKITDYNGDENILNTHHIIASNNVIHTDLQNALPLLILSE